VLRTAIGLTFILTLACAQAAEAPQSDNTIVNLSVVALDNRGQPVNDLTAADFEVIDAGKPRKVAFLNHIDRRLSPGPALAANEFSNRRGSDIPHATVILLDLMNERFSTRSYSANQLVRYLPTVENPASLCLYFLTIDGKIFPVRPLPGAEEKAGPDDADWTRQIKITMDTAMRAVLRTRPVDMDVAVRVQLTYRALEEMAARMAGVPGRKNIVWVTDGVPLILGRMRSDTLEPVDFTEQLRQLSAVLDRSGTAIYPVRQIMLGSKDAPPDFTGAGQSGGENGVLSTDTLNQFADMTGGRPDSGKDIGAAVTQAMNDARTSYRIGYYAPPETWDGKFHKLRVSCTRKGVRIQARTGYYAWPEESNANAVQAIRAAMLQNFDATEIGIRAVSSKTAGGVLRLNAVIDARDIALLHESDRYTAQLSIAVAGYDASGAPRSSPITPLNLSYTLQDRDKALAQGIDYAVDVPVDAGLASLRLIAFDEVSRAAGAVTIPVNSATK
jgi:VWFA-related protein